MSKPVGSVVHVNDGVEGAVYIGRAVPRRGLSGSPLANPYRVEEHGRETAILRYEHLVRLVLMGQMTPDGINRDDWFAALREARGKPLACWCRHDGEEPTPERACHGDVLLATLETYTDGQLRQFQYAPLIGRRVRVAPGPRWDRHVARWIDGADGVVEGVSAAIPMNHPAISVQLLTGEMTGRSVWLHRQEMEVNE